MDEKYRVVIIGAGPAGVACALQLKRHGIPFALVDRDTIGGLLRNANLVENYPGFPRGISGPELVELFAAQLRNAGLTVRRENIRSLEYRKEQFYLRTDSGWITAELVVLAPGTKPRRIPELSIPVDIADRVFDEVFPLIDMNGKTIAVIGAGDAALDYALNLARANKVVIINRSEHFAGLPLLYDRCLENQNISYFAMTRVEALALRCGRIGLSCINGKDGARQAIGADYLLIAVGREPDLDLIGGTLTERHQTLIDDGKLYLIGDVKNGRYRQTAISVGDGIAAAMKIAARAGAAG